MESGRAWRPEVTDLQKLEVPASPPLAQHRSGLPGTDPESCQGSRVRDGVKVCPVAVSVPTPAACAVRASDLFTGFFRFLQGLYHILW